MIKPFLQDVAEDLIQKFGGELQHAAIIFNNKRPAAYLQQHLAEAIKKPFWSPSFYAIQEFFALSTDLKIADPFTQFFALYTAYNRLIKEEGGTALELSKFYPIARIILNDFAQIDNDLVAADVLFKELENIAEIDFQFDYLTEEQQDFLKGFWASYNDGKQKKQQEQFIRMWRRMPTLYRNFHADLKEQGYTTMANVYRQLAESKDLSPGFLLPFSKSKLVFIGFNALSKAEEVVFKRWQEQGIAVFYFDVDAYYMGDAQQEAGLFLRRNVFKSGLINALGEAKAHIKSNSKTVDVYETMGATAEAKILSETLARSYPLLNDNNAGKMAIILADESLLLPVLQTIPTRYTAADGTDIPINLNVTMGYPFAISSIFGLVDLWLTMQADFSSSDIDYVDFKDVEAFLSHPLTGVSTKTRSKIQQILIKDQLVQVPVARLQGQKGLFELFFKPAVNAHDVPNFLLDIIRYILEQQLSKKLLRQIEADLFVAAIKDLNRLYDALKAHLSPSANPSDNKERSFVLSLVQKVVSGISVPLSGEPLQGIQVMGLLESRNLDFEEVYVLGMNEGILPQTAVSPSFIPDGIRRAYGLPVLENQDAISAYMFYRLLQRSKKVSLVYNAQADESNTGEPSRFLRQLEYESGYTFNYLQQQQQISAEARPEIVVKKDADIMKSLQRYLTGETRLSATGLTTYINCPLQFFFKYVARIEEPKEVAENVEANSIGSILHWVMETFYRELMRTDKTMTTERIRGHRKTVARLCERGFAFVMFENEHQKIEHSGMQKVVLAIVKEYANLILNFDEQHAPFDILGLEQKDQIQFKFDVNGVENEITLFGIIDRIDRKNGVTRIVDYKTGGDILSFSSLEDAFDTLGNKQNKALIQTLFYTHVFEKANNYERVELNIYSTRNIGSDKYVPLFLESSTKTHLSGEHLEAVKAEFLVLLRLKLAELFDENIPFTPSTNESSFMYSPYATLCGW